MRRRGMGKREEKKKELKNRIILAAKTLFSENGYEETSIEQIAEKAGVGMGTAYNYFKSKEELYILAMAENMAYDFELSNVEWNQSDVSQIVSVAVMKQIKKIGYVNKKVLRTAFPFIMKGMNRDDSFLREAMKIDFRFMDRIRDMLNECKKSKRIAENFHTDVATDLIFSAVIYQLMSYVFIDEMTFDQACENISEGIHFIISGKSSNPS
jgi:AcrR family transcriptional regulator